MDYIRGFYADHIPVQPPLHTSQAASRQSLSGPELSLIFSLVFLTSVLVTLVNIGIDRPRLENHPMCGKTTGGQVSRIKLIPASRRIV